MRVVHRIPHIHTHTLTHNRYCRRGIISMILTIVNVILSTLESADCPSNFSIRNLPNLLTVFRKVENTQ